MRLTALFLLIASLHVAAAGWAQKVTLNERGAPLKKIFKEIKQQTGYVFFYKAGLLDNAHPVTIVANNEDLDHVLEQCFQGQPITFNIVNKTIVVSARRPAFADPSPAMTDSIPSSILITGRVVDASGKPLAGASVAGKGKDARAGVSTDREGAFRLNIRPGATIVVSFVGFVSQEMKATPGASLDIRLVPGTKDPMANMVVTGYQVINKESFTGNAITVSGEDLKKVNPNNILQSLQAFDPSFTIATNNLAGSNPNVLPSINVRGSTALPTGSSSVLSRTDLSSNVNLPTFILDGYEVSLEKVFDLDVNRIQSVTLLKDAAATAVYGSRAANGVMVITTKAPKEGKLSVYYNYELTPSAPDLSAYHVLNARQKLDYERLAGLYTANPNTSLTQDQLDQEYYQKKLAVVSGINTDWLAQPLRNAFGQKHSLFLEGGNSEVRYGIDLQYQTSPGVMKGSSRDRYGIAVDLSYSPTSVFIFKNVLSVQQVNTKESPYGNFYDYVKMNPYYPKTDSLGHVLQTVDQWQSATGLNGADQYRVNVVLNPMFESTLGSFNKASYLELTDNFSGEWNITRGLRLRSIISYDRKNSTQDNFVSPLSNQFYFYRPDQVTQKGSYFYATNAENTFDGSLTLNYNRQLGPQYFNLALGANVHTYSTDYKSFKAVGFANDRFTNIGFSAGYPADSTAGGDFARQRLFGSFLTLNYTWLNKYLLDLTVRADGSSQFGGNNRVAPFWSAGIGWNVHKEHFLVNTFVSQLRLRASTGLTGSVSFPPYMSETTYSYYTTNWYSTGIGAVVNNYGNQNLKWQQTHNYDAGADLGLFKDRIVISPRYYYKLTRGVLADIQLPPSAGFSSYTDNLGDMVNRGFELNFKVVAYHSRDWNVSLFANLVHNTNVIKKISNSLKNYNDKANQAQQTDSAFRTTPLLHYQEGQPLNEIYAVRSLGIDPESGKEIFVKKDGSHTFNYDVKDIAPMADPTPKVQGSFGTSLSYKGFQLNTIFMTTIGGKDYNQTLVDRVDDVDPHYNVDSRALADRWKKPGDHAMFKNIADQSYTFPTSRFIQNQSTLTLSSVYLSYDFSKAIYSRMSMRNLRVAFTTNDLFYWSTEKIERGIYYPYARSFTFSIQTSF